MLWIILGFVVILAGMFVVMLGSMVGGMALMVGGAVLMCANYVTMMRGRSQDPEQGSISGVPGGKGKQQSDAVKADISNPGEHGPEIWEKMKK